MPATQGGLPSDDLSRRWHDLAERRLAHFVELYESGRWQHYYRDEEQFAARMLEAIEAVRVWAQLAGRQPPSVSLPTAAARSGPVPSRAELATAPRQTRLRSAA